MTATLRRPTRACRPSAHRFDLSAPGPLAHRRRPGTHTLNVGNLLFPTGERFFNDSLRNALPLRHRRAHPRRDPRLPRPGGHPRQRTRARRRPDGRARHRLPPGPRAIRGRSAAVERPGGSLPEPFRSQAVFQMLAATAAAEHFTASLAGYILSDNTWADTDVDREMQHLFIWHAAEEIEHRHVATMSTPRWRRLPSSCYDDASPRRARPPGLAAPDHRDHATGSRRAKALELAGPPRRERQGEVFSLPRAFGTSACTSRPATTPRPARLLGARPRVPPRPPRRCWVTGAGASA